MVASGGRGGLFIEGALPFPEPALGIVVGGHELLGRDLTRALQDDGMPVRILDCGAGFGCGFGLGFGPCEGRRYGVGLGVKG